MKRTQARVEAYDKLIEIGEKLYLSVKRSARMGNGKFMTVARWQGEYRVMTNGKLDLAATLENLKKAQQLLDTAFP
ncbi:hypothetical protein [Spirosoma spitsbergense]|uniref:hypothetical protein n=1 Tax=Spirosoma spitsbergense TaxID=431554 RepID=UPI000362B00B|nr:hypothetical protein [Spirosoma spitsbergense]